MKRKNKNNEEEINLSNKEKEILDSYNDNNTEKSTKKYKSKNKKEEKLEEFEFNDEEDEEEYEDFEFVEEEPKKKKKEKKTKPKKEKLEEFKIVEENEEPKKEKTKKEKKKKEKEILSPEEKKANRRINIVFIILLIFISLIAIDVTAVLKYNSGPFFAIPLKKYNNGETTVYYGLGYKVIKYNETNGKHGTEIGYWNLKYNNKPTETHIIDLAIDFNNNEQLSYNRYNKSFLKVTGTIEKVSEKQKTITISYIDTEGGKYSLSLNCKLNDQKSLEKVSTNRDVTIVGTMTNYKYKTESNPGTITLNNCYVIE